MATDTARAKLELASGRSEATAPFHQTSQRRRQQPPPAQEISVVADVEPPPTPQVVVDVPLAPPAPPAIEPQLVERQSSLEPTRAGRPTWIAFGGAIIAVAAAVWLVMFQRLPDINPDEVIQRNLRDAREAMADGRYSDPPEDSALHHYSTVLALDPKNTDAIVGIDAIADRHLTNARVLLAEGRVAEAGVAIEKARRVRPNHSGLAPLDTLLRVELRRILAASATLATAPAIESAKPPAKVADVSTPRLAAANSNVTKPAVTSRPETAQRAAESIRSPEPSHAPATEPKTLAPTEVATAALVTDLANASAKADPPPRTSPQTSATPHESEAAGHTANVEPPLNTPAETLAAVTPPATSSPPPPAPAARRPDPKIIRMVQPEYPQEALMRGIEGWVDVSMHVTAAGDVLDPRIEESNRGRLFNRAALTAVQQWKYESRPESETGERLRVRVQFRQAKN